MDQSSKCFAILMGFIVLLLLIVGCLRLQIKPDALDLKIDPSFMTVDPTPQPTFNRLDLRTSGS